MSQNFIASDRGQVLLMPPSLVDWLPEEHFVWTVLGAVDQMDLSRFYGAYRANGQGRAAYDPAVMLGLLLYAYASGISSSRQIERCCEVDVAFKVITAMRVPDHSTIAEFRRRHQDAIADVFVRGAGALCGGGVGPGRGDRDRRDEAPLRTPRGIATAPMSRSWRSCWMTPNGRPGRGRSAWTRSR